MSDRLEKLLAEQAAAVAKQKLEQAEARQRAEAVEIRRNEVRALIPATIARLEAALDQINTKMLGSGVQFSMRAEQSGGDLVKVEVRESGQSTHRGSTGIFRIQASGSAFLQINSANMTPWSTKSLTIEGVSEGELVEFLTDLLEAKLHPMSSKRA